jgi:hypothetical protein
VRPAGRRQGVRVLTIKNMLEAADEQFLRVKLNTEHMQPTVLRLRRERRRAMLSGKLSSIGRAGDDNGGGSADADAGAGDNGDYEDGGGGAGAGDGVGGGGLSRSRSNSGSNSPRSRYQDLVDEEEAHVDVCRELVADRLTCRRRRVLRVVHALEFLLRRLGCGAVARRVSVESVLGSHATTQLGRRVAELTATLADTDGQYRIGALVNRHERQVRGGSRGQRERGRREGGREGGRDGEKEGRRKERREGARGGERGEGKGVRWWCGLGRRVRGREGRGVGRRNRGRGQGCTVVVRSLPYINARSLESTHTPRDT